MSAAFEHRWTEREDAVLRDMWCDPAVPMRLIVERLGKTKSAVCGRAGRTNLPLRGGNKKTGEPSSRPYVEGLSEPSHRRHGNDAGNHNGAVRPLPADAGHARKCQWPTWGKTKGDLARDPRPGPSPAFCGERSAAGSSYCGAHRARAYVPLAKKRAS